jgi:hypothetical protein
VKESKNEIVKEREEGRGKEKKKEDNERKEINTKK